MLKKTNRLVKKNDFDAIFKHGKSVYSPVFLLRYRPNQLKYSRLGVIVSNKVSKKATLRNTIKRKIRAIMRLVWQKIKSGEDVVIMASPRIIDQKGKAMDSEKLANALNQALSRAKLIL
jgi:ribonuclease P protein component